MKNILLFSYAVLFSLGSVAALHGGFFSSEENKSIDRLIDLYEKKIETEQLTRSGTIASLEQKKENYTAYSTEREILTELRQTLINNGDKSLYTYATARVPTPILKSPDYNFVFGGFTGVQGGLHLDAWEQVDELDVVALPKTVMTLLHKTQNKEGNDIYKVRIREIGDPGIDAGWYVDERFLNFYKERPEERISIRPSAAEIKKNLLRANGSIYVRGGNWYQGIPQIKKYYPAQEKLSPLIEKKWSFQGVDCSGLLYQATNGTTPRNTSKLAKYGEAVDIEGKNILQIMAGLKPLDLIVRRGHVRIVLDKNRVIESRWDYDSKTPGPQGGVKVSSLKSVLDETMETRRPVNDYDHHDAPDGQKVFVVRRRIDTTEVKK